MALSVSGSTFQNMALRYLGTAIPTADAAELSQLVTGSSGSFYQSLSPSDKHFVVEQVTAAIRDSFYYLCGVTAIGFISSLFLSVSYMSCRQNDLYQSWMQPSTFVRSNLFNRLVA